MFERSTVPFFRRRAVHTACALLLALSFLLGGSLPAVQVSAAAPDASHAGTWQTWVLESGSQLRLPPPPDKATTAQELKELKQLSKQRDEAALLQIAYWDAGPPSYRWQQMALAKMNKVAMPAPPAYRNLALLDAAMYDATVAAWDSKYAYNRPRPSVAQPELSTAIAVPATPSYPSEYAVTAGAAAAVLSYIFPDDAAYFEAQAQAAVQSRLLAGVEYPSDVEAGLTLGRQVAELVIERGKADHSTDPWTGTPPTGPGHWTGENPGFPALGTWTTWVLASGDQFRPAPPPVYDSEQMAAEMDEVRAFARTPVSSALATFWEGGAGGRRHHWLWNEIAHRLILEAELSDNAPAAARAYALVNMAAYDAAVACWDAKFTYWSMRPFQLDPTFQPLFNTPPYPGYPSAHSCLSTAVAGVLGHLFPTAGPELTALAEEAGESRIWGGIHIRADIIAGNKLGHDVAGAVIAHAMQDGAE